MALARRDRHHRAKVQRDIRLAIRGPAPRAHRAVHTQRHRVVSARRDRHHRAKVRRDIRLAIPVVAPRAHGARRQRAIHISVTIHVFLKPTAAALAGCHLARVRGTAVQAVEHAVAVGIHVGHAASTASWRLLQRVKGAAIRRVLRAVVVVVGIGVVASAVSVRIHPLSRVVREGIGGIEVAVIVIVGIKFVRDAIMVKVRAQLRRAAVAGGRTPRRRAAIELDRDQVAVAIAPGSGNVIARVPHANAHIRAAAGGTVLHLQAQVPACIKQLVEARAADVADEPFTFPTPLPE